MNLPELKNRIENIRTDMETEGIDALLITDPKNLTYLTGIGTGQALITQEDAMLWVKDLYMKIHEDLYFNEKYEFDVREYEKDAIKKKFREFKNNSKSKLKNFRIENIGIENPTHARYNKLMELTGEFNLNLKETNIVMARRAVKSEYEIEFLKKSAKIAIAGMKKAYEVISDGVGEIREIDAVAEIEYEIRKLGSDAPPFGEGMLFASGSGGANIHGAGGDKKISAGDLVVVDLGARYNKYYSDMTRTIPAGDLNSGSGENAGSEKKDMLEFVENLELETIDLLEVGMKASDWSFKDSEKKEETPYEDLSLG